MAAREAGVDGQRVFMVEISFWGTIGLVAVEALFQIALCSDCPGGRGGEEGAAMRP
jgi:hypothetical protein